MMFQFGLKHREAEDGACRKSRETAIWGSSDLPSVRFPSSRRTSPRTLSSARHFRSLHAGAGGARNLAISPRISTNNFLGTATSAIWKVT